MITNLQEATAVLRAVYPALEAVLDASEPMQQAYFAQYFATGRTAEDLERVGRETGYDAFFAAVEELVVLFGSVDMMATRETTLANREDGFS